jgi:integrase
VQRGPEPQCTTRRVVIVLPVRVDPGPPLCLPIAQRVLAIPAKRHDRPMLGYLSRDEVEAVQRAPDANSWSGRRDRALFAMLYNTGARVSEAIGLRRGPTAPPCCRRGRRSPSLAP